MLLANPTTRRKFLLSSLLALPAAGIGLKLLTAAQAAELAAPDLAHYRPEFFSAQEWKFVLAACDRIIPAEGRGPGALETNVPIFIDQQMHGDYGHDIYLEGPFNLQAPPELGYQIPFTPQQIYHSGIKATNAWCHSQYGKDFCDLDTATKDAVLQALQTDGAVDFAAAGEAVLKPKHFISELLSDNKNGYLSDPIYGGNKGMKAWIAIGFPGARASYLEWITQHNVRYPLGPVSLSGQRA